MVSYDSAARVERDMRCAHARDPRWTRGVRVETGVSASCESRHVPTSTLYSLLYTHTVSRVRYERSTSDVFKSMRVFLSTLCAVL